MGGSSHSTTPRHESDLNLVSCLMDLETWNDDIRRTLKVATWFGQQRREEGYFLNPIRNMTSEWFHESG